MKCLRVRTLLFLVAAPSSRATHTLTLITIRWARGRLSKKTEQACQPIHCFARESICLCHSAKSAAILSQKKSRVVDDNIFPCLCLLFRARYPAKPPDLFLKSNRNLMQEAMPIRQYLIHALDLHCDGDARSCKAWSENFIWVRNESDGNAFRSSFGVQMHVGTQDSGEHFRNFEWTSSHRHPSCR